MREICTSGSIGRGPETGSRRRLNGHEAGNGGHGQVNAYGVPRRPPTLPSPCSAARAYFSHVVADNVLIRRIHTHHGLAAAIAGRHKLPAIRKDFLQNARVTIRRTVSRNMGCRCLAMLINFNNQRANLTAF